jgi:hypothetical protein
MEITLTKTVEVKHEITLPAYFKSKTENLFYSKIYSKDNCIHIHLRKEIGIKHATIAFCVEYEECTESDFLIAFNETKLAIEQLTVNN